MKFPVSLSLQCTFNFLRHRIFLVGELPSCLFLSPSIKEALPGGSGWPGPTLRRSFRRIRRRALHQEFAYSLAEIEIPWDGNAIASLSLSFSLASIRIEIHARVLSSFYGSYGFVLLLHPHLHPRVLRLEKWLQGAVREDAGKGGLFVGRRNIFRRHLQAKLKGIERRRRAVRARPRERQIDFEMAREEHLRQEEREREGRETGYRLRMASEEGATEVAAERSASATRHLTIIQITVKSIRTPTRCAVPRRALLFVRFCGVFAQMLLYTAHARFARVGAFQPPIVTKRAISRLRDERDLKEKEAL